jgi:hypothetical protein
MKEVGRQQAGAKEATTSRQERTKQATMEALQLKRKRTPSTSNNT